MFAGGLVVLLVMAGLVIDTGIAFRERRQAQNTADLAAMAGTRAVAVKYLEPSATVTGTMVYDAIADAARANGCSAPCTWTAQYVRPTGSPSAGTWASLGAVTSGGTVPPAAQGVTVTSERHPSTFFLRVVGRNEWGVGAGATGMASQLPDTTPPGILLPIGIYDADYETGREYTLTSGYEGPGNFGWISWIDGVQDAVHLADWICNPNNPAFTFPAWFQGNTGVINSNDVRDCIQGYIDAQTVVYVPIWEQTNSRPGANLKYEITGVAAFVLTDYDLHAVEVTGRFVEFYSYPSVPAGFGGPPCSATLDPNCNERFNFIGLVQ
jgi:hypothetical protein